MVTEIASVDRLKSERMTMQLPSITPNSNEYLKHIYSLEENIFLIEQHNQEKSRNAESTARNSTRENKEKQTRN